MIFTGNLEQLDVQSKSDSWEPINDGANKDVGQEDEIAESKGVEAFQDDETDEESNDVSDQVSCKCKDKTNKALISSLQACTSALSVLQNCKKPKKQNPVSKKALTSCKCSAKLTAALTNSLKSCTDALGSMTSCKGGAKK